MLRRLHERLFGRPLPHGIAGLERLEGRPGTTPPQACSHDLWRFHHQFGRSPVSPAVPTEPDRIGGLPEDLPVTVWDEIGDPPRSEDLTGIEFFVVPYGSTDAAVALFDRMPSLRVVQSLSAGIADLAHHIPPDVVLCNGQGVHDASTAELAVSLTLASLRGIPNLVRARAGEEWQTGFRHELADRTVLLARTAPPEAWCTRSPNWPHCCLARRSWSSPFR
ncbi:hypothetical protein ACIP5U_28175 [Streptomyces sp. NPDC088788]|uniref:hypothetical protein n=1 Tax=Streptomyces sp. NPDC088788 TaxID=3365898 RepID=UPI0038098C9D